MERLVGTQSLSFIWRAVRNYGPRLAPGWRQVGTQTEIQQTMVTDGIGKGQGAVNDVPSLWTMPLDRQRGQHWHLPWCPEMPGAMTLLDPFLLWLALVRSSWRNAMRAEEQDSLPPQQRGASQSSSPVQSRPQVCWPGRQCSMHLFRDGPWALLPQLRGPPDKLEASGEARRLDHSTSYASCHLAPTMNMTTRRRPSWWQRRRAES